MKSCRNSLATCLSTSDSVSTSPLSTASFSLEKMPVWVLSCSTSRLTEMHASWAAVATVWSGCACRTNSAMSATRHSSSLRSSNMTATFRVLG